MTQLTLDEAHGQQLKTQGIQAVESHNQEFIRVLRELARWHSQQFGYVTTDDLRGYAVSRGLYPTHPNAWGAVLKGKGWTVIGRKTSALPSNHAREIRVYKWEGQ